MIFCPKGVAIVVLTAVAAAGQPAARYFPPPDIAGGWRTGTSNPSGLDEAFEYVKLTSKHGGLLVVWRGRLIYERYFGRAHREASPNTASIGKSFTSIATGILISQRPELFPQGLDQKIIHPRYFPAAMFPLSDPRRAEIKLGQLLSMTAGIRGNNPGIIRGRMVKLDPAGPDGWQAMVDQVAFGQTDGKLNTQTLWVEPGGGYSYATSSVHLASVMLRHVTGMELEDFVRIHLAQPLGWGRFSWGYRDRLQHTGGGGGIAARPTDMLRFAYLLLRGGNWNGRQLAPKSFVAAASHTSPYNPHAPYSLQFQVNDSGDIPDLPRDLFWKSGSGGHCIYIIPSLDLVVYKMGGRDDQYPPGSPYDGSRETWTPISDADSLKAYHETIRKVIAAVAPKRSRP